MPIYEYECEACQKVHEVSQKMADAPIRTCPSCGGSVRKLISRSAFAFKGSGFYTTDYKRAGKSAEKGASCGANSGACGKAECAS